MIRRLVPVLSFAALAAACASPPPPPPPAPAPVAAPTLAPDSAAMRRAHRLFEEGVVFGRQSRWREAETRYRAAADLHRDFPTYHHALANALLAQSRITEAADAMRAAIDAEERSDEPNLRVLAVDYERWIDLLTRLNRMDEVRVARERLRRHREANAVQPPE